MLKTKPLVMHYCFLVAPHAVMQSCSKFWSVIWAWECETGRGGFSQSKLTSFAVAQKSVHSRVLPSTSISIQCSSCFILQFYLFQHEFGCFSAKGGLDSTSSLNCPCCFTTFLKGENFLQSHTLCLGCYLLPLARYISI